MRGKIKVLFITLLIILLTPSYLFSQASSMENSYDYSDLLVVPFKITYEKGIFSKKSETLKFNVCQKDDT